MKTLFFFVLMMAAVAANAQFGEPGAMAAGNIQAGAGYVHDFPGMHGIAEQVRYSFPLNEWLQGGIGGRHIETAGYPRTSTVREYTKANAIDFELLLVPVHTEHAALRAGLGYTFSFYNIRRSYPVYTEHEGQATAVSWPVTDSKGTVHGTSLVGEYEYYFGGIVSAGVRVEVAKAYGYVVIGGPFMAVKW